jgi:NADH dehydrogenase/NADH:ubiquinone oxidoreductase subunit G
MDESGRSFALNALTHIRADSTDVKVLVSGDVSLDRVSQTKARVSARRQQGRTPSIEGLGVPVQDTADENTMFFDTGIRHVSEADVVLLIGTDPRKEAPLLNVKLREAFLRGHQTVYSIGNSFDLTFPVEQRGLTVKALKDLVEGTHPLSGTRAKAKKPMIIRGASVRLRKDQEGIRNWIKRRSLIWSTNPNYTPG